MADMNSCTFTGHLTKDCTQKVLPTGTQLVECDIANNTGWGDKVKTTYITVNLWGKQGDGVKSYLLKSTLVAVTGELEMQTWQGKDGTEHKKLVLNCNRIILLSSKKEPKPLEIEYEIKDDNVPF